MRYLHFIKQQFTLFTFDIFTATYQLTFGIIVALAIVSTSIPVTLKKLVGVVLVVAGAFCSTM